MNKIKYVSKFFRLFFQATFVCLIIAQILGWMYAPRQGGFFNVLPQAYQNIVFHALDANTRVAGFSISCLPLAIKLVVVYFLIKLFHLYEQQEFFSAQNVYYVRGAGYALLLLEIIRPISDFLLGFIITAGNPSGYRVATFTFDDANIGVILIALIIILNSWIMMEACKLKDEQQLII